MTVAWDRLIRHREQLYEERQKPGTSSEKPEGKEVITGKYPLELVDIDFLGEMIRPNEEKITSHKGPFLEPR